MSYVLCRIPSTGVVTNDSCVAVAMLHIHKSKRTLYGHVASPIRSLDRRRFASLTDLGNHPHGFTLERTKHVPELQLTAFHLRHQTGAEYLHVARDDKNNVFSIGFKTNPPDDTGVPHILEHTTLCGSEKYSNRNLCQGRFC